VYALLDLLALDGLLGLRFVQSCGALLEAVQGVEAGDDVEEETGEPETCCLLRELLGAFPFPDA
jgi:hypothetical protein